VTECSYSSHSSLCLFIQ